MIRGTKVGQAYVALTVDGSGVNKDLADSFDDVDFDKHGQEHGRQYREGLKTQLKGLESDFNKAFKKSGKKNQATIESAFANRDALRLGVKNMVAKAFDAGALDPLFERAGVRSGHTFGDSLGVTMRGAIMDSLEDTLTDMAENGLSLNKIMKGLQVSGPRGGNKGTLALPGVMNDQALAAAAKDEKAYTALVAKEFRARQKEFEKTWAEGQKLRQQAAKEQAADDKKQMEGAIRVFEIKRKYLAETAARELDDSNFRKYTKAAQTHVDGLKFKPKTDPKALRELENDMRDFFEKSSAINLKLKGDIPERERARLKASLEAMSAKIKVRVQEVREPASGGVSGNDRGSRLGDRVGRMFGAGSRNNGLNLIGKTMGNIVNAASKVTSAGATMFKTFTDGFANAGEGANFFQKLMSGVAASGQSAATGIGKYIATLVEAGPAGAIAFAVALAAAALAASVLVSVLSALAAIVVALAATIASALVGSVIVLGGALSAAAAAGGLLAVAFLTMNDAQKKALKTSFKPLLGELRGIGQLVLKDLVPAFKSWADNISAALTLIAPLAKVMGPALADMGTLLTAALSGPGFQQFYDALGTYLPGIVRNMTVALGGFMNGMGSFFAAIMPFVSKFAQYLSDVATRFANWAASTKGKNAIVNFTERALTSLKSLWGFAKQFFGFITDLLFSPDAQDAGNTMFDKLANSFESFRSAVETATKNGNLKKWFEDAAKFGESLGHVVSVLAGVFQFLDSSGVLKAVTFALNHFGTIMIWLSGPIGWGIWAMTRLISVLGITGDSFNGLKTIVGDVAGFVVDSMGAFLSSVLSGVGGVLNILSHVPGLKKKFKEAADNVNGLRDSINTKLKGASESAYGWGEKVPDKFGKGVKSGKGKVAKSGDAVVAGAKTALKNGLPAFINIGKDSSIAFGTGMDSTSGGVSAAGSRLTQIALGATGDPGGFNTAGQNDGVAYSDGLLGIINQAIAAAAAAGAKLNPNGGAAGGMSVSGDSSRSLVTGASKANKIYPSYVKSPSPSNYTKKGDSSGSGGGGGGGKTKAEYKNPYVKFANSLIKDGPSVAAQIKAAIKSVNAMASKAVIDASKSKDSASVASALGDMANSMKDAGKNAVSVAQEAINSAAQALASATSKKGAKSALKKVRKAQKDMTKAVAAQKKINAAAKIVNAQRVVTNSNVTALLNGKKVEKATLADYAAARGKLAVKLETAKQKLVDAIALRDDFKKAVSDSAKSFAGLLTAQAKTINGVEQALTATDITDNLRDRLAKIEAFRNKLQQLVALGLNNDAYKQLVDSGVEDGSKFADAIIAGGSAAVADVNQLTTAINATSDALGLETSNRLYQAGVNAAQGLVDGLTSLSAELDSAATKLGTSIAKAIADALGIKSPSTVLRDMMDHVGDGSVIGLNNQHKKVSDAATSLSQQIAVSPEVAQYAASQNRAATVSGNELDPSGQKFRDLIIQTPTENPKAVAQEMLNEMTGRF